MAEQMYAQASEAEATASAEAETSSGESKDDNVVDAEFEEVKDDKGKK
jgi:hypothetical protein